MNSDEMTIKEISEKLDEMIKSGDLNDPEGASRPATWAKSGNKKDSFYKRTRETYKIRSPNEKYKTDEEISQKTRFYKRAIDIVESGQSYSYGRARFHLDLKDMEASLAGILKSSIKDAKVTLSMMQNLLDEKDLTIHDDNVKCSIQEGPLGFWQNAGRYIDSTIKKTKGHLT